MIEIFKCLEGLSSPIINEIFMLRNIPHSIRNSRYLNIQLPQMWQQLSTQMKNSSSLVSLKLTIKF